jgi:hypothetical protein
MRAEAPAPGYTGGPYEAQYLGLGAEALRRLALTAASCAAAAAEAAAAAGDGDAAGLGAWRWLESVGFGGAGSSSGGDRDVQFEEEIAEENHGVEGAVAVRGHTERGSAAGAEAVVEEDDPDVVDDRHTSHARPAVAAWGGWGSTGRRRLRLGYLSSDMKWSASVPALCTARSAPLLNSLRLPSICRTAYSYLPAGRGALHAPVTPVYNRLMRSHDPHRPRALDQGMRRGLVCSQSRHVIVESCSTAQAYSINRRKHNTAQSP